VPEPVAIPFPSGRRRRLQRLGFRSPLPPRVAIPFPSGRRRRPGPGPGQRPRSAGRNPLSIGPSAPTCFVLLRGPLSDVESQSPFHRAVGADLSGKLRVSEVFVEVAIPFPSGRRRRPSLPVGSAVHEGLVAIPFPSGRRRRPNVPVSRLEILAVAIPFPSGRRRRPSSLRTSSRISTPVAIPFPSGRRRRLAAVQRAAASIPDVAIPFPSGRRRRRGVDHERTQGTFPRSQSPFHRAVGADTRAS